MISEGIIRMIDNEMQGDHSIEIINSRIGVIIKIRKEDNKIKALRKKKKKKKTI